LSRDVDSRDGFLELKNYHNACSPRRQVGYGRVGSGKVGEKENVHYSPYKTFFPRGKRKYKSPCWQKNVCPMLAHSCYGKKKRSAEVKNMKVLWTHKKPNLAGNSNRNTTADPSFS
jgi:hypothetical protein